MGVGCPQVHDGGMLCRWASCRCCACHVFQVLASRLGPYGARQVLGGQVGGGALVVGLLQVLRLVVWPGVCRW